MLLLCCLLLTGCATLEAGPRRVAENTCNFIFLLGVPIAGTILGAAACSFGLDEIPEENDDVRKDR